MTTAKTSGQRLEILKELVPGLTNDVIGEWFGLTAQAVQKWTKAEVPRNRFATIVNKTGVSEEWLVLGKGEPFHPIDDEDTLPAVTGAQMQLAEEEGNGQPSPVIIPEQKHIAQLDEDHPPTETHHRIQRFDVRLSAGNGNAEWVVREKDDDPLYFRKHWFVARHLDENNLRAMYVSGDSMEPYLYDKDTVIIDITETDISDGDVYAILFKGKFYVKELRNFEDGVKIISRNPEYETMKATPENCKQSTDFQVLGRVVWRGG